MRNSLFCSAFNLLIYIFALIGLYLTYLTGWKIWYWSMLGIFFIWHLTFFLYSEALSDRKPDKVTELVAAGRLTSSWYFAIFAGAFAFIIVDKNRAQTFLAYARSAGILTRDLFLPVTFFFVGTLIVPIKLAKSSIDKESITWSARALVFVNGTAQNFGVYTILTLAIRFIRILH